MLNSQIENNGSTSENTLYTDSRQQEYDKDCLWDKLNLSQQYAICSLGQFGYILSYVRTVGTSTLAIVKLENKIATINMAGAINLNPAINCRQ